MCFVPFRLKLLQQPGFLIRVRNSLSRMMAVSQHLAEVSQALRNAQRRKRRMLASHKLKHEAIHFHRQVALHLRQQCEGRTEVALDYLAKQGCHRESGQPWTDEDIREWSHTISVEPSADSDVISDESSISTEFKAAHQFLLESRVYDWVRHQNEAKGLTPMMKHTVARYERIANDSSAATSSKALPKTPSGRWKWGKRWTRRWKVFDAELKAGVRMPLEQRRAKAAQAKQA